MCNHDFGVTYFGRGVLLLVLYSGVLPTYTNKCCDWLIKTIKESDIFKNESKDWPVLFQKVVFLSLYPHRAEKVSAIFGTLVQRCANWTALFVVLNMLNVLFCICKERWNWGTLIDGIIITIGMLDYWGASSRLIHISVDQTRVIVPRLRFFLRRLGVIAQGLVSFRGSTRMASICTGVEFYCTVW